MPSRRLIPANEGIIQTVKRQLLEAGNKLKYQQLVIMKVSYLISE